MATFPKALAFIGIPYISISLIVADRVLKSSGVELLGFDTSGDTELVMRLQGSTADITSAAEAAQTHALALGTTAMISRIPAPSADLTRVCNSGDTFNELLNAREQLLPVNRMNSKAKARPTTPPAAIGVLETHGFTALLHATDKMVKAANVTVVGKEKIGAGLISIIIEGDVAAVTAAIAAGREAVGGLGKVIAAEVIMARAAVDRRERTLVRDVFGVEPFVAVGAIQGGVRGSCEHGLVDKDQHHAAGLRHGELTVAVAL